VSYFCVGTELRFLALKGSDGQSKNDGGLLGDLSCVASNDHSNDGANQHHGSGYGADGGKLFTKKDSEMWHGRALRISCAFLPSDCPLVSHVISSYIKHHLKPKV
jgi:hypothetical protein